VLHPSVRASGVAVRRSVATEGRAFQRLDPVRFAVPTELLLDRHAPGTQCAHRRLIESSASTKPTNVAVTLKGTLGSGPRSTVAVPLKLANSRHRGVSVIGQ
jgi:hypothetical protein